MLRMKIDHYINRLIYNSLYKHLCAWFSRTNKSPWAVFPLQWWYLLIYPLLSPRHSVAVFSCRRRGRGEWRGACQNECDADGTSRLPSKNHVAYSSRVAPLLVCTFFSPSLYSSSLPFLFSPSASRPWYTWRTTVLYVALQDAFSRSSSPYPFSINDVDGYLPLHVAPAWRHECARAGRKKKSGSINEIVCAVSYADIVPTTGRSVLFRICQVTCLRIWSFTRRLQPIVATVMDLLLSQE